MENWDDLRVFLAVARHGSTTAAAQALALNPTTLGRRITSFETRLAITLFLRDTRGYHLTPEGEALLPHAQAVDRAIGDFAGQVDRLSQDGSGTIRISAPETVFDELLADIVSEFRAQHPDLRFLYLASDSYADLMGGEADVAFRGVETPDDGRLIGRRLRSHKWTVYAGQNYRNPPSSPAELVQHPVAIYRGHLETLCPHQWFLSHVDRAKITAECNTQANMRAAIRSGTAVGLLSCSHADHVPGIHRCFDPTEAMRTNFWLVASPAAYRRPPVRAFIQFAARRFNEQLDILQGAG